MGVNTSKFKIIFINNLSPLDTLQIEINKQIIKPVKDVKLLGITIDSGLNFDEHISKICRSASNKLNALVRLGWHLSEHQKKVLIESYVFSQFNYCPLVWHFSSINSLRKVESVQKRALQFLFQDYTSSYQDLLRKAKKPTMSVSRIKNLCEEIFNTISSIGPTYMHEVFKVKTKNYQINLRSNVSPSLQAPKVKSERFGKKSLTYLGSKTWNELPNEMKTAESESAFKLLLKKWEGPTCKCSLCQFYKSGL